ncbi:RusA family crossover junction endodeoxyribonuclease [Comamonas sp. NoAH]|uniref:RusA family crossover junction endodeoxyribonuclease n=1 Tax=Comamonas halotolerans TaxID=3041496 RepID=UPI0024E1258F|nr:RusA family crossover junction endodeoxyribonuclease [Comamonas sp. NoAH]
MMPAITLTLPYPVSSNRYWATRIIKMKGALKPTAMIYVTPEAKAFKEKVQWLARQAGVRTPFQGRFNLLIILHPHCPQDAHRRMKRDPCGWEDTVQCMDLDNAQKVTIDALKGVVFEDDKRAWDIHSKRGTPVDGGKLVVTITPIAPAMAAQEQGDLLETLA